MRPADTLEATQAAAQRLMEKHRRRLEALTTENAERKDFTPTEAVAIGRLIEEKHRSRIAAVQQEQRVTAGQRSAAKRNGLVNPPPVACALGPTRETAARAVGMDPQKYTRAKAAVSAAESDPERFGDLPEIAPARPDKSRNGVLYTVVADDVACGFLLEGLPGAGPEPLLWEEFLGRKEVFLG